MLKTVYRSSCRDKHNCQRRDSNLGPLTPQSDALTTRPLRPSTNAMSSISSLSVTWKSAFYLNATHPSDHSHLCSLKCHLIFFPYRPAWPGLICMEHTVCTLYISFIAELALTAMSQIVYQAAAGQ